MVCQEFEAISKDPEVHLVDDLITDADRLVSCLAAKVLQLLSHFIHLNFILHNIYLRMYTFQVAKTFDISLMGASSRSCKYVLNTLMQVICRILWDAVFY